MTTPSADCKPTGEFAASGGYPALTWSAEKPKAAGWWWANNANAYGWECVLVQTDKRGDLVYFQAGVKDWSPVGGVKEWAGPLTPPVSPTDKLRDDQ